MNLCIGQGRSRATLNVITTNHSGWKTIDVFAGYAPDECYDVAEGIREPDASVEKIWMGDVLEHFPRIKVPFVLAECHRVLAPAGELLISVPDMAKVMPRWLADPNDRECNWLIWGEQDESGGGANASGDTHRCGFTERLLGSLLLGAGFANAACLSIHGTWYELAMKASKGTK